MLVSRLLFLIVFGLESGCPGLENQAFYKGCIAKKQLSQKSESQGPFFMILGGLGTKFHVDLGISVSKLVTWHAWWLHFGVLGNLGAILGHLGAQERTL